MDFETCLQREEFLIKQKADEQQLWNVRRPELQAEILQKLKAAVLSIYDLHQKQDQLLALPGIQLVCTPVPTMTNPLYKTYYLMPNGDDILSQVEYDAMVGKYKEEERLAMQSGVFYDAVRKWERETNEKWWSSGLQITVGSAPFSCVIVVTFRKWYEFWKM
jgi:hypothetical protein